MDIIKKIPFEHDKKKYEIAVYKDDTCYKIRALFNNKPVNPWVYIADNQIDQNEFFHRFGETAYDHLIKIAKSDVIENRWEKILASVR